MNTTTNVAMLGLLFALGAASGVQATLRAVPTDLCVEKSDHSCSNNGCATTCGHPDEALLAVAAPDNCWCLSDAAE